MANAPSRVVVTGVGPVSAIGTGVSDYLDGLRAGRNSAHPIEAFDTTGFDHVMGCEVKDFDASPWVRDSAAGRLGRAATFAVSAARIALDDAAMTVEQLRERRCLISVGTTDGEAHDLDTLVESALHAGRHALDPVLASRVGAERLSSAIAHELGLTDVEAVTLPTACAAGNYAIGYGYDAIRAGDVDVALSGGADAMCRKTFTGFYRVGTIAPDVCRPFDVDREGILTGEGAGILVLERLEAARARKARIYAEVLGYGLNCDAYHQVAPDESSVARCMELALADAGTAADDVDFISAHGTGTRANDLTESAAIRKVFGADTAPRTVSIKSMLGHSMGAASALSSIACVLAIVHGFVPPTINHVRTDPDCGLDCVPNRAVDMDVRVAQNNALAFGGNNAVVLFGRT